MNYERIYEEFIRDRRTKSPDGTFEVHHILPRSLGGTDDQSNLIPLTPEDHFFAHLLLAKIHGGRLWVPVVMWLGGDRRNWSGRRSRLEYGWARRAHQEAISGEGSHRYDQTIYEFEHTNGTIVEGVRSEIREMTGVDLPSISNIVNGKIGSSNGWFLAGNRPKHIGRGSRKGKDHPMLVRKEHTFRHVDGREFVGTQFEFAIQCGVSKSSACLLVNGKQSVAKGWYIEGTQIALGGRARQYAKAANDNEAKSSAA